MIEFEINTNKKQIDFEITQGIPKYVPANFQSKTVVPTTEQQIVRADIGYDGLEQVTVEPIKVLDKTITENGTYNAESDNLNGYSSVEVNVQPTLQEKSITITENGTTEVVADSGYDGLAKVSVEANVQDNSLLNVIKGMNSYATSNYPFELTADMWDENSSTIYKYKYYYNQNIIKVTMSNNIKEIGEYAFSTCYHITDVVLSNTLTTIRNNAFRDCSSLTSIAIPDSVTSIESSAFYQCKLLNGDITINNVTILSTTLFYKCENISSITATKVKTLLDSCIRYCTSLTNVNLPNMTIINGNAAFGNCTSLINIDLPQAQRLGNYTFQYCSALEKIVLPNATNIGTSCFQFCTSLSVLDFRGITQIPTLANINAFQSVPTTCKFIIPDELYDEWIVATNWASLYASGYQFVKASEYTEA